MKAKRIVLAALALTLLPLAALRADLVFLKTKRVYEGKVTSQEGKYVEMETASGTFRVLKEKLDTEIGDGGVIIADRMPRPMVLEIRFKHNDMRRARQVLAKVREGEDFSELAKNFSIDPATAMNGGNHGYLTPGALMPEIEYHAFQMKPGETSGVFESDNSLHIIKVEKMRYQDRVTREFFDQDGEALPLMPIKVRLFQVVEEGRDAAQAGLGEKVYKKLKETLESNEALELKEMTATAPEAGEQPTMENRWDYSLTAEVALVGDVIRVSYRVANVYNAKWKEDTGTFQGVDRMEEVVNGFARDIWNSFPKAVDEEKASKKENKKKEENPEE